ncbi:MAG: hypothetical protein ACFB00_03315 [Parvularculaceae bacterium]
MKRTIAAIALTCAACVSSKSNVNVENRAAAIEVLKAWTPTAQDIEKRDAATPPTDFADLARRARSAAINQYVWRDPSSVVIEVAKLAKSTMGPMSGWFMCGRISAKNSFGGYGSPGVFSALVSDDGANIESPIVVMFDVDITACDLPAATGVVVLDSKVWAPPLQ